MSKLSIASNTYYDISYDAKKNRFYLNIKGFWPNAQAVSNYVKDWQRAFDLAQPQFTLITDVSTAKTHTQDVMVIREQAQRLAVKAGILQAAEVMNESVFLEAQAQAISQKSHFPRGKFQSVAEAELWLDSLKK